MSVVSNEGREMGRLVRTGFWRARVEILTAEGLYMVKTRPFGGVELLWNGHCCARLHSKWNGTIEMSDLARPDRSLILKRPSFWRSEHHLMDAEGRVHAVITSRYNWKTWRTEHTLVVPPGAEAPSVVMLLAAVHAIDERRRRSAAAAST